jgi:deoxyribose-phosphate aldolase
MADNLNLASYIDHTLLKPDATPRDIEKLCQDGEKFGFFSVCVNSCYIKLCRDVLKKSKVKVCSVIDFPMGASQTRVKLQQAQINLEDGADELDMVMNIGFLKAGRLADVENDIGLIADVVLNAQKVLKVIIEAPLLTEKEKREAALIVRDSGAGFVKTCTGFGGTKATIEDVVFLHQTVGEKIKVKASGGIRDYSFTCELIKAGAERIGTSAGVQIIEQSEVAQKSKNF